MRFVFIASVILLGLASCRSTKTIYPTGLYYAQIGSEMPAEGTSRIKGHSVKDTVFSEGGYEWRATVVKYGKSGNVYLEDGFWGEGKVNRIRVESPKLVFHADEEVHVGMDWNELKPLGREWQLTYLENYGLVDVFSAAYPSMHFLIRETPEATAGLAKGEGSPEVLNSGAKLVAIVLM